MEITDLENIAYREKISVVNDVMKHKAKIIDNYIFMDYSKIHTKVEEKCLLAEELGHYYYGAYYSLNSSQNDIDRAEYKAMKWKSLVCVSRQSILSCFHKGIDNLYDIAEELSVEPNMVEFAINYYKNNGGFYG